MELNVAEPDLVPGNQHEPEAHQHPAHVFRLGPAIVKQGDGPQAPDSWLLQLFEHASPKDKVVLFMTCRGGRDLVLQSVRQAECSVSLDTATAKLQRSMQHVLDTMQLSPELQWSLRLQQQAEQPQQEQGTSARVLAVQTLSQRSASINRLDLDLPGLTPAHLTLALTSFPHITRFSMGDDLTDDSLALLLQLAPQLTHVSVASVCLTRIAAVSPTCNWEQLAITNLVPQGDQPRVSIIPAMIPRLPVRAQPGGRVVVLLPKALPVLQVEATSTGLVQAIAQRLEQNLTFSNLTEVVLVTQQAADEQAVWLSLQQLTKLQLQAAAAEPPHQPPAQPQGAPQPQQAIPAGQPPAPAPKQVRLTVKGGALTSQLWQVLVAEHGNWQELAVVGAHPGVEGLEMQPSISNLVCLDLHSSLTDALLGELVTGAPGLRELSVTSVRVASDEHALRVWKLDTLRVTSSAQAVLCADVGRLPLLEPGQLLTVELMEAHSVLGVSDINEQGLQEPLRERLAQIRFRNVAELGLGAADALPAAAQPAGLTAAVQQLQAAGVVGHVGLILAEGWFMDAPLAERVCHHLSTTMSGVRGFSIHADLDDVSLPVLAQRAPQLETLRADQVLLASVDMSHLSCDWTKVLINGQRGAAAQPVHASTLLRFPQNSQQAIQVDVPRGAFLDVDTSQGVNEASCVARRFTFLHLRQVQLQRQHSSGPAGDAEALMQAANALRPLLQGGGRLCLHKWPLTPEVWAALVGLKGWQEVDLVWVRLSGDVALPQPMHNLRVLAASQLRVDAALLEALAQNAPNLKLLCAGSLDLTDDGYAQSVWLLEHLLLNTPGQVVKAESFAWLPMQPEGQQLTVQLPQDSSLECAVTQEGLTPAVRARLATLALEGFFSLYLTVADTVPATAQPQALRAAQQQLQAAGVSKVQTLDLGDWTMSAGLAQAIRGAAPWYEQLSMSGLTWPDQLVIGVQLPAISQLQLASAVVDDVLEAIMQCIPYADKVVFTNEVSLSDQYKGTARWRKVEVTTEGGSIISLVQLSKATLRDPGEPLTVAHCDVVFGLESEEQAHQVQTASFLFSRARAFLCAPRGIAEDEQMVAFERNSRALAACFGGAAEPFAVAANKPCVSVTLLRWLMRPAMVAQLPHNMDPTTLLILSTDLVWPSVQMLDDGCPNLECVPQGSSMPLGFRIWQLEPYFDPHGVAWVCRRLVDELLRDAPTNWRLTLHLRLDSAPDRVRRLRDKLKGTKVLIVDQPAVAASRPT